jgi:hypothetical protein
MMQRYTLSPIGKLFARNEDHRAMTWDVDEERNILIVYFSDAIPIVVANAPAGFARDVSTCIKSLRDSSTLWIAEPVHHTVRELELRKTRRYVGTCNR